MRVGVIHDSLRLAGGGERVCLKTIESLRERGHEVLLGTVEPTDWNVLTRVMGECVRPNREIHLINLSDTPLRIYMSLGAPLIRAMMKDACDICIQTNGDVVPVGDLIYMHYLPTSLCDDGSYSQGSKTLRRLYSRPYAGIFHHLVRKVDEEGILVNSQFTRNVIRRFVRRDARVVYPPVEVDKFKDARGRIRHPSVVACGRFSPEKNFEVVLDVAALVPEVEFKVVGTLSGATSRSYYERLLRRKETMGLKNVTLVRNVSFSNMLDDFGESRILISTKVNEPFGLSVVEGMAAGLTPLVHQSGGPWIDSLDSRQGIYGYSYASLKEAARIIRYLLVNIDLCESVAERNSDRVEKFSDAGFKRSIGDAVESLVVRAK
jgi:alpha-1,2-mannosyltransferase